MGLVKMNLGHHAQWAGHWDEAIDWLRQAEDDCNASGDRVAAAAAGVVLGEVLVNRGAFTEADRVLRDARRVLRAAGFTPFALVAETQLARIVLAQGDAEHALSLIATALEEAREIGHTELVLEIVIQFAAAARVAGAFDRGLEALDQESQRAGDDAQLRAVPLDRVRGGLLIELGRFDDGDAALERALAGARRQELLYEELLALRERLALAHARGAEADEEELGQAERLTQLLGLSS
jgi:ATP/maltotriose-dependent transcriptional regulator MalT